MTGAGTAGGGDPPMAAPVPPAAFDQVFEACKNCASQETTQPSGKLIA